MRLRDARIRQDDLGDQVRIGTTIVVSMQAAVFATRMIAVDLMLATRVVFCGRRVRIRNKQRMANRMHVAHRRQHRFHTGTQQQQRQNSGAQDYGWQVQVGAHGASVRDADVIVYHSGKTLPCG
jgi:hypothetical protein